MLSDDIEQLESSLELAPSAPSDALAARIALRLEAVRPDAPLAAREHAVRGLTTLSHHYYRLGHLRHASEVLATAQTLMPDLDAEIRVSVLLQHAGIELLMWDVGAALAYSSEALPIAQKAGLRVAESRVWTNFGMALDFAGLHKQAEPRFAHALSLLDGLDEPRMRGNIWQARCNVVSYVTAEECQAAVHAAEQALKYAELSPLRHRDSMASTSLCNLAALAILSNHLDTAKRHLEAAAQRRNLGARPRWLIGVLEAMRAVRMNNGAAQRANLAAFLVDGKTTASAYITVTYEIMAAMYTAMGDAEHASNALARLADERARALWAALADARVIENRPGQSVGAPALNIASLGMLERLAITAELRDDATGKHCYRVGRMAMLLGQRAGLDSRASHDLDLAARLHDVGKFAIPDAILLKPGKLDAAELSLMRSHTTIGAQLLSNASGEVLRIAEQIARHHHECWDGSGYPHGLAGEAIPQAARIVALADVYDALTHVRPYKHAWAHDEAMTYIRSMRGTQFDPAMTDLFLTMMDEAKRDLTRFTAQLETSAEDSVYVVAASRMAEALATTVS